MTTKQQHKRHDTFEVVSHERAVEMHRENALNLFKMNIQPIPKINFDDVERALNTVPITNKMYHRLQKEKEKKKLKELEQQRIARQAHENYEDDLDI